MNARAQKTQRSFDCTHGLPLNSALHVPTEGTGKERGLQALRADLESLAKPRITIVRLGAIGDVVNNLPLLNALRDGFPEARLTWVVEPKALPIIKDHRALDHIIIFPRGNLTRGFTRFAHEIRSHGHDLVLDTQRHLKSGLISLFTGCTNRVGFDRRRSKEFNWLMANHHLRTRNEPAVMTEHFLEFAEALGVFPQQPRWDLFIPQAARKSAEELLADVDYPYAVVNLGASKPQKCWPPTHFARLSRDLSDRGLSVVWTGYGADDDRIAGLARAHAGTVTDLVGRTDLKTLAAVLEGARVAVACDTGPMHIAVAVGCPVIGLFGPTDAQRTGPYGYQDFVVRPADGSQNMNAVRVDDVMRSLGRLL